MFEGLPELVDRDRWLLHRGRHLTGTVRVGVGDEAWLLDIEAGRVALVRRESDTVMPAWRFGVSAPAAEWSAFWQARPAPGHHDLMALRRRGQLRVDGDVLAFMTHLAYIKELLALPRAAAAAAPAAPGTFPGSAR
jgi:hypothetical protein